MTFTGGLKVASRLDRDNKLGIQIIACLIQDTSHPQDDAMPNFFADSKRPI